MALITNHPLYSRVRNAGIGILATVIIAVVACFAAWLTHIFTCLANGEWGFLVAGALAFPIAVIHGFGIWFGFWH